MLDRRGGWRLKGEPVRHTGLKEFINRNYGPGADGCWVFQNGPQAVYVDLEYTPLVLRMDADESYVLHTGLAAGAPAAGYLDEDGNVLIQVERGLGLLDDRDLACFLAGCRSPDGDILADFPLAQELRVLWRSMPLQSVRRQEVAARFGFQPTPRRD